MKIQGTPKTQSLIRTSFFFYLLIPFLFSCAGSSSSLSPNSNTNINIDWLLGDWIRVNEEEGKTTSEHWQKQGDQLYVGVGITISSAGDTLFREDLKIMPVLNRWALIVTGVNNSSTRFLFETIEEKEFTVKNLENEFPKFIKYWNDEGQLNAQVYNDNENKIDFSFSKVTH